MVRMLFFPLFLVHAALGGVSVWTTAPDSVGVTGAVLRAYVRPAGGSAQLVFWYGHSLPPRNPVWAGTYPGSALHEVRLRITGLAPNTLYYYKALATIKEDTTVSGGIVLFRTLPDSSRGGVLNHLRFFAGGGTAFEREISFGVHVLATYCHDPGLGELIIPPEPPAGSPDFRFIDPRGVDHACMDLGIIPDYRQFSHTAQIDTYKVRFHPGSAYPVTITWSDVRHRYLGEVFLHDLITGQMIFANMKQQEAVVVHAPITELLIVASGPRNPVLTTGIDQASTLMNSFHLEQNYPNPFNPVTTIPFHIPIEQFVVLQVINLLGQEVATVVQEVLPAGSHHRTFNAHALAGGVYFYRLGAGGNTTTRSFMLLK